MSCLDAAMITFQCRSKIQIGVGSIWRLDSRRIVQRCCNWFEQSVRHHEPLPHGEGRPHHRTWAEQSPAPKQDDLQRYTTDNQPQTNASAACPYPRWGGSSRTTAHVSDHPEEGACKDTPKEYGPTVANENLTPIVAPSKN